MGFPALDAKKPPSHDGEGGRLAPRRRAISADLLAGLESSVEAQGRPLTSGASRALSTTRLADAKGSFDPCHSERLCQQLRVGLESGLELRCRALIREREPRGVHCPDFNDLI